MSMKDRLNQLQKEKLDYWSKRHKSKQKQKHKDDIKGKK